ncbi:MAG TPA: hypothetical protein VL122_07565 [Nitrospirota bacterium]|nr:hypothetical protein [Nitrospirota bacterium]
MPFIRKRRIWWGPVSEAASYVVYVGKDDKLYDPAKFLWEDTPDIVSKPVIGKTELIVPDEWPEFPKEPGTYHIGITSRDDVGNQSDPFLLSGLFKFLAPPSPSRGGIESLPMVRSIMRQGRSIIQGALEEVRDNEEVLDAYLGGSS